MPRSLTARAVESTRPDPAKRLEIPDGLLRGLYLVVQPPGAKSWAARYRSPVTGKPVKLTLGPYPRLGLSEARAAAGEALRAAAEGEDPAATKSEAKAKAADRSDTCSALLDETLAHVVGDDVERAYRRGDALEKRRGLMEAWARFLGDAPAEVVPLAPRRRSASGST